MSAAVAEEPKAPPAPTTNFLVKGAVAGFMLGKFGREAGPLPRWWVERSGRTAEEMVNMGLIEPTFDTVKVDLRSDLPKKTETDPEPEREAELARLRAEVENLKADNRTATAAAAEFKAQADRLVPELGKQAAEITHWRGLHEAAQKELDDLKKNLADPKWVEEYLDKITTPPPKSEQRKTGKPASTAPAA